MVRYYKVNSKVAEYLGVKSERNLFKDGTYLLWQNDLLRFGPLTDIPGILRSIGGIGLTSSEAKQEQDGTVLRPLPEAEDIRFKTDTGKYTAEKTTVDEVGVSESEDSQTKNEEEVEE